MNCKSLGIEKIEPIYHCAYCRAELVDNVHFAKIWINRKERTMGFCSEECAVSKQKGSEG